MGGGTHDQGLSINFINVFESNFQIMMKCQWEAECMIIKVNLNNQELIFKVQDLYSNMNVAFSYLSLFLIGVRS